MTSRASKILTMHTVSFYLLLFIINWNIHYIQYVPPCYSYVMLLLGFLILFHLISYIFVIMTGQIFNLLAHQHE